MLSNKERVQNKNPFLCCVGTCVPHLKVQETKNHKLEQRINSTIDIFILNLGQEKIYELGKENFQKENLFSANTKIK